MIPANALETARLFARSYLKKNMIAGVEAVRVVRTDPGSNIGATVKVIYRGVGRLHMVGGPSNQYLGDELTVHASSNISTPISVDGRLVDIRVDDQMKILRHEDELMVGRVFRVIDVDYGGQFSVHRTHQVTTIQPSAEWKYVDEPNVPPWP